MSELIAFIAAVTFPNPLAGPPAGYELAPTSVCNSLSAATRLLSFANVEFSAAISPSSVCNSFNDPNTCCDEVLREPIVKLPDISATPLISREPPSTSPDAVTLPLQGYYLV